MSLTHNLNTQKTVLDDKLLAVKDLCFSYNGSLNSNTCPNNLAQHYGELSNISFSLKRGEKVALVGANGSGKSTLLLLLSGCLHPQQGSIILNGEDVTSQVHLARKHAAVLFQDPDNQLFMPSVREELLFSLAHSELEDKLDKTQKKQAVDKILEKLGIEHLSERPPHHLSVGEKKRVALASLLITDPLLLLLDEPSAALDPRSRRKLLETLKELDTALLMATHDLDLALELADKVIVLHEGKITAESKIPGILVDAVFLEKNALELPLSLLKS
ncbi:energy-coupling factor ABC transporter ATP-binding protein [Desulfovibrio litoralis]|uniref:Cobalt/nickel transport system ATP-binding protein n=1 Tax=Desulfovibrio litoralis DSM 11393 TaxID=1121455 RepID=A0A1M7S694_9BACT|nr:ABC transporter ATP-binding protein [Desulfovibrio litoralis]SHN53996.1 cobalt/nickel transport system ATP-binding protein [Desulfovibrio litoralis DSM 11393]